MSTIYERALDVLDLAVAAFQNVGVSAPARQFVYPSPVPADCAQLVVLFTGTTVYPEFEGPSNCFNSSWYGTFIVAVSRTIPKEAAIGRTGTAPPSSAMNAVAEQSSRDAEVLMQLAASFDVVDGIDLRIGAPQGGITTVELDVRLPL